LNPPPVRPYPIDLHGWYEVHKELGWLQKLLRRLFGAN
jgi:hypothetical protein